MTLLDILVLAVVQGATEFLPVSSSGHLVLANAVLGLREPGITTEIVLHLGTLVAVVFYFRKELWRLAVGLLRWATGKRGEEERAAGRLLLLLVIGTIPAVLAGVFLDDWLTGMFENPRDTAIQILITAAILFATLLIRRGTRRIDSLRAALIGIGQAIAIVPGISRSGTTIATALFLRVEPREAARFSFLLSIPAIVGAAVFEAPKMAQEINGAGAGLLAIGFLVSMVVGWVSIAALLRIVQGGKFGFFGIWCVVVGVAGLLLLG